MTLVDPVGGAVRVLPLGIDFQESQETISVTPQLGKAIPLAVHREMTEQPRHARRRGGIRGRCVPIAGALEDRERGKIIRNCGNELHR